MILWQKEFESKIADVRVKRILFQKKTQPGSYSCFLCGVPHCTWYGRRPDSTGCYLVFLTEHLGRHPPVKTCIRYRTLLIIRTGYLRVTRKADWNLPGKMI